jgi:hypothetical protein
MEDNDFKTKDENNLKSWGGSLHMTKFQRYYCTFIDFSVAFILNLVIANFIALFVHISEEIMFVFIFVVLAVMQTFNANAMAILFKHHMVLGDGKKINFIVSVLRHFFKAVLLVVFIFTFPISFIVFPFHTDWDEKEHTVIDKIFNTRAERL